MPSPEMLLHAHPVIGWWTGLYLVAVLGLLSLRRPVDGRAVAAWALGTLVVVSVAPPRGGMVHGIARTCDLRPEHLLWPWDWVMQDPRMGLVALMLLAGLSTPRRARWVAGAAGLPALLEAVQYAVPSLARACSVPDLLHAWMALGVGLGATLALSLAHRATARVRRPLFRLAVGGTALVVSSTAFAGWSRADGPLVDPHAHAVLEGGEVHDHHAWLDTATVPGAGTPYEAMARAALRDIDLVTPGPEDDHGLPYAGPSERWRYFWPRDGSFVAVALVRTGREGRAVELLSGVGSLYLDPLYGFDARYLLSGDRVEVDPRRAQVDGCGWVLWAIHEAARSTAVPATVDDLRDRCTDQLLRATGGGSHLPAPGQDYWEQTTYHHLLGASAPVAAGLRFAAADYHRLGDDERAQRVQDAAEGVRSQIERTFGPGYQRAATHGGLDAATAMLMPPFDPAPLPGLHQAWLGYQQEALRPAGGLAPGSGWKQDGMSWTPEVALVAYTAAAAGEDEIAHHWLDWLDRHRAPWGSLPEKVDAHGRPGGPAPLAWTSALVILTLEELASSQAP